jgi:hypothetical protein
MLTYFLAPNHQSCWTQYSLSWLCQTESPSGRCSVSCGENYTISLMTWIFSISYCFYSLVKLTLLLSLFLPLTIVCRYCTVCRSTLFAGVPCSLLPTRLTPCHIWPWELLAVPTRNLDRGHYSRWSIIVHLLVLSQEHSTSLPSHLSSFSLLLGPPYFSVYPGWCVHF